MGTQCDYLEELLTAVFVAHTKVLSSIRLTNKQKRLQITIPKLEHYLHKTLIECARLLWTNTYLFSTSGSAIERQKNMRQVETLILDGIHQGIRLMLPVKSILREYLSTEESDNEEEEEEEEEDAEEEVEEEAEEEKPVPKAKIDAGPPEPPVSSGPSGPVSSSTLMNKTGQNTVNHTSSPTNDFNPDQFDIFQNIEGLPSKSPAPEPKPQSRPSTPKIESKKEELPVIELSSLIPDNEMISTNILDDAIEFEEL
jgi:hypothetical protein